MCDYSLSYVKTRDAVKGDKLVTTNFGTGTRGFAPADDKSLAVCVRPGTEIGFDEPIKIYGEPASERKHSTAIFRQINRDRDHIHHDALEMPDGKLVLLTFLMEGQKATVLQLPAAPRNKLEADEQKRVSVSG